ncbi:MAG TPA: DHA2 family efflux MFS transporter permease subunit [Acidimicrobiales bacterium]|nr:DHA2 family efflux MFS transporter permease subunit [Acidimicrobiales bacterium]
MPQRLRALDQRWVVAIVFVAAMFMSLLDTTIVTVALPTLADEFAVGTAEIEWVVVGYLVSLAVFMPASGWISDRFGAKRTFLVALALFTTASVLCGLAGSLPTLVAFRVLQGVGGGLLVPVGMAMLFRAFPPADRARASRVLLLPTAIAPASGPVLGGVLVDNLSWHWIFLVNIPIGIAAFVFGWALLEDQPTGRGRFDLAGFVLSGAGLALVLYALDQGASRGWATGTVVATGLLGVSALVALVVVELRLDQPMLDLRLLGNRLFRTVNATSFAAYGSFLGVLFLMPLFLQEVRQLSATESGLTTFTEAFGVIIASQIASRLYPRVGPRRLMVGGLAFTAAVSASLALVGLDTDIWLIRLAMFALGLGMGFMIMSQQAAAFAQISPADTANASAIYSMLRQTSSAVGVAVLATVLKVRLPAAGRDAAPTDQIGAYQAAFLVAAALAAVSVVLAATVRDRDAAATMRSPTTPEDVPRAVPAEV